jgi:hypothetical protein
MQFCRSGTFVEVCASYFVIGGLNVDVACVVLVNASAESCSLTAAINQMLAPTTTHRDCNPHNEAWHTNANSRVYHQAN